MPVRRSARSVRVTPPRDDTSPLVQQGSPPFNINADGSLSVVRDDDEANNSGLLDLTPNLPTVRSTTMPGTPTPVTTGVMSTPVLGGDTARMPPPLLGKGRARKVSRNGAPWTRAQARTSMGGDGSSEESNASVIVHETPPSGWEQPSTSSQSSKGEEETKSPSGPASASAAPANTRSTLPARLRRWMHDALKQHLYETAIFWGQQVVALEPTETAYNDAYWLAQAYFLTHQYERAEQLLTTPLRSGVTPPEPASGATSTGTHGDALHAALAATRASSILPPSIRSRYAHADTYASVTWTHPSEETEALGASHRHLTPNTSTARRVSRRRKRSPSPSDPFHAPDVTVESIDTEFTQLLVQQDEDAQGPCLVNWSSPCRYLAAQCQVRLNKLQEALDLTGEDHTRWTGRASARAPSLDGGIKLGSSVCHLRGQIYMRLDEPAKAKEAFLLALALDVKNYDSFSALIDGQLLGEDEQWDLIQTLEFAAQAGSEAEAQADFEWVRWMYTTRLSQRTVAHAARVAAARQTLVQHHQGMRANPTVLLSLAESLWLAMRYEDAYAITQHILALDAGYTLALPIHIACMYYLPRLRPALFLLAHALTESQPDSCEAWYAVGTWYASAQRWSEARRHFSKASLLDPRFAPSWIAFGHSFAFEGESDQAITAYSTAARKFPNSGLPRLFIGMEHLSQGNHSLAQLFLQSAAEELGNDPLCANERGVALFQGGRIDEAIDLFRAALEAAAETQQPASAWCTVHLNLGLAYRKLGRDDEARPCFLRVIEYDAACAPAYIALGMCAHRQGDLADAVGWYHEGLGIDPRDPIGTDLLALALDARAAQGLPEGFLSMPEEQSVSMDESSILHS